MFDALFTENKLAEIEFGDPEKFRSIPSLALPAICLLDEYLTRDMYVFEWGSGASTLFFAHRCRELVSIEHDEHWYEKVREAMIYREMIGEVAENNWEWPEVTYYLRPPQNGYKPDFASQQPGYESVNFRDYVEEISMYPDESFDLILVDGRARCACLEAAQSRLKPGGILMLDDSARSIYQWAMAKIEWPVRHFEGCIPFYRHGHTVRTTVWVKE